MGEAAESVYVPEAGKVAIKDLDGSVSLVRQGDLAAAQGEGARPATEAEYFGAKHGTGGQVASALVGAARGASFGLSDPLYVEGTRALAGDDKAEDVRRTMRLLKEANPGANLGGEIGGAVVPMLFGAPPAEAGGALGEGLLARGAARAAAAAPRAIGEGAAIGLGSQLSEDTLNNHKLAGEAYLTAGLKGGAIGLLLGAGGAAGLGAASDKAGALFGRGEGGALRAEEGVGARVSKLEERAAGAEEAVAQKGPVGKWLDNASDIQSFKGATNAKTGDIRRLGIDVEAQEGTEARLGKMLRDEGLTGPLVSQAESAKRVTAKAKEVAATIRPIYRELDAGAVRPEMNAILLKFDEAVRTPALERIGGLAELKPANTFLQEMVERDGANPTFEKLWGRRRELDEKLAKTYSRLPGVPNPPGEEALRGLKNVLNDEIAAAAEKASPELAQRLRVANQTYSDLKTVEKIATHQAGLNAGANAVSITDVISASHGGPVGVAMAAANMVRRKFGNQLAAHVLGSASRMESIQSAATKLDSLIGSGTKAFVDGSKTASRAVKPVTTAEVRALRDATRTPEIVNAKVADHLGDLPQYAPKVAQQVAATASRAAAWLQHALPKETPPIGPLFNQPKPRPLSDSDLIKARATIETIEDPTIVVDRMRQGRLTAEHVAALKYVHPETYLQIQKYLDDHAVELRPTLTVQQQFSLGMLFGTPITEAALPENVRAFQASFSQGNQAPGKGGAGGVTGGAAPPTMNAGPVKGGGTSAMSMDRLEAGSK